MIALSGSLTEVAILNYKFKTLTMVIEAIVDYIL